MCVLPDGERSSTSSLSSNSVGECNMWNPHLSTVSDFVFGPTLEDLVPDEDLGRVAMTCHFALDLFCAEMHNASRRSTTRRTKSGVRRCRMRA